MIDGIKHADFKVSHIKGRYVTHNHIRDYLFQLKPSFRLETLGSSVQGNPIYGVTIGSGTNRILMWSQMHGNESTTTKAVLDLINYLKLELGESKNWLKNFTIMIIPILNPDGAKAYTRVNADQVDLNRDAQELSQPESRVLMSAYDNFKPDYCFNLHDQRTIFNVGETDKPATVSFLAPAFDEKRNLSESRTLSMQLIAAMNKKLQEHIPGQVGRYDDSFNPNCVGDAFQMLRTPTMLFEAGHYPGDYDREVTREYICMALMEALVTIKKGSLNLFTVEDYLAIPENRKMYCDVLIYNAHLLDKNLAYGTKVAILFDERLTGDHIVFVPKIESIELQGKAVFGHETKDAANLRDRLWLENRGVLTLF
ncbi:M14 metallopeptidase family protein [Maribacter chungangensis]|uniref:M14 metallopeptidase family protein n=1 Tax=Maribacter chungangensis TaxID=1069117 RepID=A0ABW3B4R0_9FLAO